MAEPRWSERTVVQRSRWALIGGRRTDQEETTNVARKKIALIGAGNIGSIVAARALGLAHEVGTI